MAVTTITAILDSDIETVWSVVTSLDQYGWRSDLERIEVLEQGRRFIEYTKDGRKTTFTITASELFQRYEFRMENENLKGHWRGIFRKTEKGTYVSFTEDVDVKKVFLKPVLRLYLKRQQKQYLQDLRKALEIGKIGNDAEAE